MLQYKPDPNHKPNPSRFEEYDLLPDHSGFTIYEKGSAIDFFFDPEGGWYDEYANYYNQNGDPAKPSQKSLKWADDFKNNYQKQERNNDFNDDLLDEYERAIEDYDDESEGEEQRELINQAKILSEVENLKKTVSKYNEKDQIKIMFSNINYLTKRFEFVNFVSKSTQISANELDFQFLQNEKGQFNGKAYIFTKDRHQAQLLITLHRKEFSYRQIYIDVDPLDVISDDDEVEIVNTQPISTQHQNEKLEQQQQLPQVLEQVQIKHVQEVIEKPKAIEQQTQAIVQSQEQKNERVVYFNEFPQSETLADFKKWVYSKQENLQGQKHEFDEKNKQTTKSFKLTADKQIIDEFLSKLKADQLGKVSYKGKCSFKYQVK